MCLVIIKTERTCLIIGVVLLKEKEGIIPELYLDFQIDNTFQSTMLDILFECNKIIII